MTKATKLFAGAAAAFGFTFTGAYAQDTDQPQPNPPAQESAQDIEVQEPAQQTQDSAQRGVITPGQEAGQKAQQAKLHQVDDLIGAQIRNPQEQDLGEIEEMVVDANDGSIRYAVVSYGGFLDLGDELFAVPLKAMKLQQDQDGEAFFVVDIDKQRLENAQGFDNDNWPNFADQSFTSAVNQTYGIEQSQQQSAGRQGALYKLSTFEGVNVRDQGNTEIGEVNSILVDSKEAKVALMAIELQGEAEEQAENQNQNEDGLVLIPMKQFSLKTQNDDTFLQVQASSEQIQNAPKATEEQLQNASEHMQLRQKAERHFGGAAQQSQAQPQADQPQTDQPQTDQPQTDEPQTEEPVTDSPL